MTRTKIWPGKNINNSYSQKLFGVQEHNLLFCFSSESLSYKVGSKFVLTDVECLLEHWRARMSTVLDGFKPCMNNFQV